MAIKDSLPAGKYMKVISLKKLNGIINLNGISLILLLSQTKAITLKPQVMKAGNQNTHGVRSTNAIIPGLKIDTTFLVGMMDFQLDLSPKKDSKEQV